MEISGYKVTCPDLKSAGVDPSDPNHILTLEDYDQPLTQILSALPDDEKVGSLSLNSPVNARWTWEAIFRLIMFQINWLTIISVKEFN